MKVNLVFWILKCKNLYLNSLFFSSRYYWFCIRTLHPYTKSKMTKRQHLVRLNLDVASSDKNEHRPCKSIYDPSLFNIWSIKPRRFFTGQTKVAQMKSFLFVFRQTLVGFVWPNKETSISLTYRWWWKRRKLVLLFIYTFITSFILYICIIYNWYKFFLHYLNKWFWKWWWKYFISI